MIDKSSEIAAFSGIHDVVLIDPEEVGRADTLLLVPLLTHVRNQRPEGK